MSSWQRATLLALIGCCALALGACAGKSRSPEPKVLEYPFFERPDDSTRALTCVQLDRALRRVDAVRWSMRRDGKRAFTQVEKVGQGMAAAGMSVLLFPFDPVNATVFGAASVAIPFSDDMVTAADARIIGLLKIKSDNACAARAERTRRQDGSRRPG